MQRTYEDYKGRKIGELFGNFSSYKRAKNIYWRVMAIHNMSPLSKEIPEGITPEEYSYWYPFHQLMQEKMASIHEKNNQAE